jgi:hypothetical protein
MPHQPVHAHFVGFIQALELAVTIGEWRKDTPVRLAFETLEEAM